MAANIEFSYDCAFSRNLGLVSEAEQQRLRSTCVALAGLGGVGGAHLQALARLGIGQFRLADPDCFEVVNFNRQIGATLGTVGRNKAEVMAETLRSINPVAALDTIPEGISEDNIGRFLDGADYVVDGIEFFCIGARRLLYRECRARGIPVVNAGPIGYGAALLVFLPDGIPFEEFFGISAEMTRAEQLLAFGLGLGPGIGADLDSSRIDFKAEKGPALGSACLLCAAVAATEVLKLVCGRGTAAAAPNGIYFDPFRLQAAALNGAAGRAPAQWRALRDAGFIRFPVLKEMHADELMRSHLAMPRSAAAAGA